MNGLLTTPTLEEKEELKKIVETEIQEIHRLVALRNQRGLN